MDCTASHANRLTEQIIGCAYAVGNSLGYGFLEKVYENALIHELRKKGIPALNQHSIVVYYDGVVVGEYYADILVENEIIVELKTAKTIDSSHVAQCLNYLKAANKKIGLLINFGRSRVEVKRLVNGL